MTFEEAFEKLIGHEGGYVFHPKDPGGETKYGISKRSYPNEDIKNLTLDRAQELAFRDYWLAASCPSVPAALRFDLFDMAYNSGPSRAIKTLQEAVGAEADGILGQETLYALNEHGEEAARRRFNAHRLLFMTDLHNWPAFGKGWTRRVAQNLLD
jgi:lysozyme family protein